MARCVCFCGGGCLFSFPILSTTTPNCFCCSLRKKLLESGEHRSLQINATNCRFVQNFSFSWKLKTRKSQRIPDHTNFWQPRVSRENSTFLWGRVIPKHRREITETNDWTAHRAVLVHCCALPGNNGMLKSLTLETTISFSWTHSGTILLWLWPDYISQTNLDLWFQRTNIEEADCDFPAVKRKRTVCLQHHWHLYQQYTNKFFKKLGTTEWSNLWEAKHHQISFILSSFLKTAKRPQLKQNQAAPEMIKHGTCRFCCKEQLQWKQKVGVFLLFSLRCSNDRVKSRNRLISSNCNRILWCTQRK